MKEIFQSISRREKMMLYVLLCFLLVMGGWFGLVKPQLDTYQHNREEIDKKNTELNELNNKLDLYQNAYNQLLSQQDNHKKLTKRYYLKTSNVSLSRTVTSLIILHTLKPVSLNMTSGQRETNDAEDESQKSLPKNITLNTISIICDGDPKSCMKFLDDMRKTLSSAYLSSFSYISSGANSHTRFNIVFEVYMIKV